MVPLLILPRLFTKKYAVTRQYILSSPEEHACSTACIARQIIYISLCISHRKHTTLILFLSKKLIYGSFTVACLRFSYFSDAILLFSRFFIRSNELYGFTISKVVSIHQCLLAVVFKDLILIEIDYSPLEFM